MSGCEVSDHETGQACGPDCCFPFDERDALKARVAELEHEQGQIMDLYPADTNGDTGVVGGLRNHATALERERDAWNNKAIEYADAARNLEEQRDEARAELAQQTAIYKDGLDTYLEALRPLQDRAEKAEAACAQLRAALEATEHGSCDGCSSMAFPYCAVCKEPRYDTTQEPVFAPGAAEGVYPRHPHRADCPVDAALATDAGRAMLARLERYEKALTYIAEGVARREADFPLTARAALEGRDDG